MNHENWRTEDSRSLLGRGEDENGALPSAPVPDQRPAAQSREEDTVEVRFDAAENLRWTGGNRKVEENGWQAAKGRKKKR
jgi:hypothetical protein